MQRVRAGMHHKGMEEDQTAVTEDFNRTLFRGCPVGSLELAGELTERSLGYPLNVMSMLYYECGDALTTANSGENGSAPRS